MNITSESDHRASRRVIACYWLGVVFCLSAPSFASSFIFQARLDAQRGALFSTSAPQSDEFALSGRAWLTAWLTDRVALSAKAQVTRADDVVWSGGELNATGVVGVYWLTAGYQRVVVEADGRNVVLGSAAYRLLPEHFAALTVYRDLTLSYTLIEGEADYALPFSRRMAWYVSGRMNYLSDDAFSAMYQGEAVLGVVWQATTWLRVLPYVGLQRALSGEAKERITAQGQAASGGLIGLRVWAWF
jgi:hypothetical protein